MTVPARGPLPGKNTRRRNAPTVPTTRLPASGRSGRVPAIPGSYDLQTAGKAWWKWAWKLPQAAAWDTGALYVVARRASLEDDLAVLDTTADFDLGELLDIDDDAKRVRELEFVIGRLKAMAGGRVGVMKEMRELDKVLGLSPEALARLRWEIVDEKAKAEKKKETPKKLPANVKRLRAHDPSAA